MCVCVWTEVNDDEQMMDDCLSAQGMAGGGDLKRAAAR